MSGHQPPHPSRPLPSHTYMHDVPSATTYIHARRTLAFPRALRHRSSRAALPSPTSSGACLGEGEGEGEGVGEGLGEGLGEVEE